jgi:hypothetical protein
MTINEFWHYCLRASVGVNLSMVLEGIIQATLSIFHPLHVSSRLWFLDTLGHLLKGRALIENIIMSVNGYFIWPAIYLVSCLHSVHYFLLYMSNTKNKNKTSPCVILLKNNRLLFTLTSAWLVLIVFSVMRITFQEKHV